MESEEKLMTGEESLRIITDMINKTKVSIAQSSFHLLFWGWLILLCSVSDYILWNFVGYENSWYVWLFVIPGVFVSMFYGFTKGKRERVFTYGTTIYVSVWIGFLLASVVLFLLTFKSMESFGKYILMLVGFPTFVSGFVLRFKPLILGGIAFWVLAVLANYTGPEIAGLCMPVAIVFGYLLPGYLLKRKDHHDTVQGA